MRQMHEYQIIKYFPHTLSEKFVIGTHKPVERIITENEAKNLYLFCTHRGK